MIYKKIILFVLLVLMWELICRFLNISSFLLPPPSVIVKAGMSHINELVYHTKTFLLELFIGFFLSIFIGVFLSILSSIFEIIDDIITPLIVFFQGVPKLALAPFILIFFGFGLYSKIFIIVMMGFLAIYLGTLKGLKNVNPDIIEIAKIHNSSLLQIITKVKIPSAMPDFFTGLKIAIPSIMGGIVLGEFMVGNTGLAYYVFATSMSFEIALSLAAVILLSTIGVSLFTLVSYIEKRFIKSQGN